jgi:hypothetical protein
MRIFVAPLLLDSDILDHKKLYKLWRKDLETAPAAEGDEAGGEPTLSTVIDHPRSALVPLSPYKVILTD